MENYKPNSHRSKEGQKETSIAKRKVEQVVKGKVKTKKKSDLRKFTDVFISEDAANVKSYVFMDVLVPAVKKAISDIVRDGIDMILYGETGHRKKRSDTSYVSYRSYSDKRDDRRYANDSRSRTGLDYDDLVFNSRGDVEAVREQMNDVIDRYGFVTVADFYEMADPNLTPPYTSNKYGWVNIRNAEPVRVRDGYILKLPRAMPID